MLLQSAAQATPQLPQRDPDMMIKVHWIYFPFVRTVSYVETVFFGNEHEPKKPNKHINYSTHCIVDTADQEGPDLPTKADYSFSSCVA